MLNESGGDLNETLKKRASGIAATGGLPEPLPLGVGFPPITVIEQVHSVKIKLVLPPAIGIEGLRRRFGSSILVTGRIALRMWRLARLVPVGREGPFGIAPSSATGQLEIALDDVVGQGDE